MNDYVVSVVNHNDFCPRLGIASLSLYFEVCKKVKHTSIATRMAIDFGLYRFSAAKDIRIEEHLSFERQRLFLAGRIYHLTYHRHLATAAKALGHLDCLSCSGQPRKKRNPSPPQLSLSKTQKLSDVSQRFYFQTNSSFPEGRHLFLAL